MAKKVVTIRDVALYAGTSVASVSRVVNQTGGVKPELERSVLEAVRALNYIPNNAARSLAARRTNSIGIVVNNLHDPFFCDLIHGFEDGAKDSEYDLLFCSVPSGGSEKKEKIVRYLSGGIVDGIALYGSYASDESSLRYLAEEKSLEVLTIENKATYPECSQFLIDNEGGAVKAVEHLVRMGHTRIAMIAGTPERRVSKDRLSGYKKAMEQLGLEQFPGYIQQSSMDYHSGYACMKNLLSMDVRPTAVFCHDDALASFAIRAAIDGGLQVPGDISVMGFNHQTVLPDHYKGPEITTIEQPLYQLGYDAVKLLIERLEEEEKQPPVHKFYKTKIYYGESVGIRRI